VQLIRGHLEAVGRADADAWTAPLDPNVRFDIAGSIYQGREAARGWAERDPIGQRGRYDILSLTPTATGVTADVTFRAGSLVEQIRYQYTIRGGKIIDLVARYRQ
jgi:ketosteroid isomerase-like protein